MQDDQPYQTPPPRKRSGRLLLAVSLLAFIGGGSLVGWLAQRGDLSALIGTSVPEIASDPDNSEGLGDEAPASALALPTAAAPLADLSTVETRLAMLEDRLSRLDTQSSAASGNASRAESLLIAFAARRMVERGQRLGYLEDQLNLRFGGDQPKAVQTIIGFAQQPVTLDALWARLDLLETQASRDANSGNAWSKVQDELSSLLVIRKSSSLGKSPDQRIDKARLQIRTGKIDAAIEEIGRLPAGTGARNWIVDARRYADAHHALDVIETEALFEANRPPPRVIEPVAPPTRVLPDLPEDEAEASPDTSI